MIEEDIPGKSPIILAAGIALAVLAVMELIAFFGFDESPANRNAFGYSADAGIDVKSNVVEIGPTSSRRFWQQSFPLRTPSTLKRVVVIGDSAVRGGSLATSVTTALKGDLVRRCGIAAEVWNLASPGYGSRRKALLVHKALEFAPDIIIYHASITTEYEDAREWERYLDYHSWHPRHWIDQFPFLGRARLAKLERGYWELLPDSVRANTADDSLAARLSALASKNDTEFWMPRMLSTLDRTVEEVTHAGVPLLLVSQVLYDAPARTMKDFGLPAALSIRYASRPHLRVIANREIFQSERNVSALFADASHWTDAGKDSLAHALADAAAQMLNIEKCEGPSALAVADQSPTERTTRSGSRDSTYERIDSDQRVAPSVSAATKTKPSSR